MALTLYQRAADWGIPSRDPHSLAVHAYLKFAGMPFTTKNAIPKMSSTGQLPVLEEGDNIVEEAPSIFEHLKKLGLDLDSLLSPAQRADSLALINLNLEWKEHGYHTPLFNKQNYFKFSFFKKSNIEYLRQLYNYETSVSSHRAAREIYNALSSKLGHNAFFYEKPTTLDAIVFAHLTVQLKCPGTVELAKIIHEFPNLIGYCQRLLSQFWNIQTDFALPAPGFFSTRPGVFSRNTSQEEKEPEVLDPAQKEQKDKAFAQNLIVVVAICLGGLYIAEHYESFIPALFKR